MFELALGQLALVCGLVAHAVSSLSVRGQRSRRCVYGSSRCWLTLCGRCAIVGGLRTASAFTTFALVLSVWPVAVF